MIPYCCASSRNLLSCAALFTCLTLPAPVYFVSRWPYDQGLSIPWLHRETPLSAARRYIPQNTVQCRSRVGTWWGLRTIHAGSTRYDRVVFPTIYSSQPLQTLATASPYFNHLRTRYNRCRRSRRPPSSFASSTYSRDPVLTG